MKTTTALAAFLAAGAGALGASAVPLNLKGSDTLNGLTTELLQADATHLWDCGGSAQPFPAGPGTLVYIGTGSSNGEAAIIANTQQVAPMSRFLNPAVPATSGVCALPNTADAGDEGGVPPSEQTAEGIAFARDGLAIVTSQGSAGSDACNGVEGSPCEPAQAKGLAFDPATNILTVPGYVCPTLTDTSPYRVADPSCVDGTYRILDSIDVLRLVFYGLDHDFKTMAQRNCGNPNAATTYLSNPGLVRAVLLENWSSLFRDPANCTSCTRLWRAFRRNDESGTTDAFIALTGRKAICDVATSPCSAATVGLEVTVAVPSINQANRVSPFCNTRQAAAVQCGSGEYGGFDNVTNPNNLPHRIIQQAVNQINTTSHADPPPPLTGGGGPASFADLNPKPAWDFLDAEFGAPGTDPYFTDLQDFDCVRRQCSGPFGQTAQEQVCSARGDLGVVLPIWDPPDASATVNPFPNANCAIGVFIAGSAPPCNGSGATGKPSLCPNGERPFATLCNVVPAIQNPGVCLTPATAGPAFDPRCRNAASNWPPTQRSVDARVYNLHLHANDLGPNPDHPYATATRQNPAGGLLQAKMVGAFYRIHQDNFMNAVQANTHMVIRSTGNNYSATQSTPGGLGGSACNATTMAPNVVSATTLIGCYAANGDRCSIGYSGGQALLIANADALRVNGIFPDTSCVQAGTYPISRKLYLNTVKGFENVGGDELKLAKCFADRTGASIGGGYPGVDTIAINHGFIALDTTPDAGTRCQDFKEGDFCAGAVPDAGSACTNNGPVAPIPTQE